MNHSRRLRGVILFLGAFFLARTALAQGLLGGTIRNPDSAAPGAAGLSVLVFVVGDPANSIAHPGQVEYSNGTYVARFARFPRPIEPGQTLRVEATDSAAQTFGALDVPIVAADSAHVGNLLLQPIVPAQVRVQRVRMPAQVLREQTGIRVEADVTNSGGQTGSLTGAAVVVAPAEGYRITASAENAQQLAAGSSAILTYFVDVLSTARLGPATVDVRLDADPDGADVKGGWSVEVPARIRILSLFAPAVVAQGQRAVPVSAVVTNTGTLPAALDNPVVLFSRQGTDRATDYRVTIPVSNASSLAGGESTTLVFVVAVATSAATGTVSIDLRLDADPDGAEQTAAWIVSAAALLRVASIQAPAVVTQGETGVPVVVSIENDGSLTSPVSGLRLLLAPSDDYSIVASGPAPVQSRPGQAALFRFLVDVAPLAATGPAGIDVRLDQPLTALQPPVSWTVARRNVCPSAQAGADRTIVVTGATIDATVELTGHDSVDPDRPTTVPGLPTLAFAWRLVGAVSETGTPIASAAPFLGGTATTLAGTGDVAVVDPAVRLRAPGVYRFGLVVTEAGAAGDGNAGCASAEAFVSVSLRAALNGPPAARARLDGSEASSAALTIGTAPAELRLIARPPVNRRFDRETPDEALEFRWERTADGDVVAGPSVPIEGATSSEATVRLTAPGAYAFRVLVTDDGRTSADGAANPALRRRSLGSEPVTVTLRPAGNTFPVLSTPVATAPGNPAISFSSPAVIPATASALAGGFPPVTLSASGTDGETGSVRVAWRQLSGRDAAPAVALLELPGGQARFWPIASGLYRFEVTASDGELAARAELIVPVDDLRPGGRSGVTPVVNGMPGSSGPIRLSTGAAIVLDATGSLDRNALYGRPSSGLGFRWSQAGGDEELLFDAQGGRIFALLPPGATGTYTLVLEADNGFDAVRQVVLVTGASPVAPMSLASSPGLPASNSSGCAAGSPGGLLDAAALFLPIALLGRRRRYSHPGSTTSTSCGMESK